MKNTKKNISIEKLHPFENHPYKVQDNEEMDALAESIKAVSYTHLKRCCARSTAT